MANSANQPISAKKGWDGRELLGPKKDTLAGFQLFFNKGLLHKLLAPHIKKMETYFTLLGIFLDFRIVCLSFVCDKRCGTENTMESFMHPFSS
jgi:hypothetical protein